MVSCSAVGCRNTTTKGFKLLRFPKDKHRRKIWLIKTKRAHWKPNDNSYLCEAHFDDNSWEKIRVDGKRKLKANAVPTIFSFTKSDSKIVKRKPPKERPFISSVTSRRKICGSESQQTQNRERECDVEIQSLDKIQQVTQATECTNVSQDTACTEKMQAFESGDLEQSVCTTNEQQESFILDDDLEQSSCTKNEQQELNVSDDDLEQSSCTKNEQQELNVSDVDLEERSTTDELHELNVSFISDVSLVQSLSAQNELLKAQVEHFKRLYEKEFLRAQYYKKNYRKPSKEFVGMKKCSSE